MFSRLRMAHPWAITILLVGLFSFRAEADALLDSRAETDQAMIARQLLGQSGIGGGLIVHLGSGEGAFTTALHTGENYVVQGLERDLARVELARARARSKGLLGPVSFDLWNGRQLPYATNLVNLMVVDDRGELPREEMLRVLVPGGVALIRQGESVRKLVKPWPDTIDEWTHFLHSASNNAVAADAEVGPPRHMQWVGDPPFSRSHEINPSLGGMVSAGGRLFYIWDEGPIDLADPRLQEQWSLVARDAFNGILLWKQPIPEWGWPQWHDASRWDDPRSRASMRTLAPPTLPRRLVASAERLYVTLGYHAPVTVLDASTGETIRVLEETCPTDEILHQDDLLVLRVRLDDSPPERNVWTSVPVSRGRVMVVEANTGRTRWQSEPDAMAPLTLATCGERVYYSNFEKVVCLDLASGQELWRSEAVKSRSGHRGLGGTLVSYDQVVLYTPLEAGNRGRTHAFSADTGELLWRGPANTSLFGFNPPDLFVVDDLVWIGETDPDFSSNDPKMAQVSIRRQGFEPVSGEVVREVSVPKLASPGHHYRCYRSKATERYLLLPKRGVEFVDLLGDDHMRHDWLRAPCLYGVLPANGILYMAPHECVCYPGVLLSNFNAMVAQAPEGVGPPPPSAEERREPGPAWEQTVSEVRIREDDWPTYRRDARRSGSVSESVPDRLQQNWEVNLGGNLTQPVMAEGRLLVAEKEAHTVHALDAESGKVLWRFSAGARIDSPPTVHGPRVLFGSADGWVYCLRATDGKLVWRFMAAPRERRIAAFGQFESAWPVHGSVLVQEDTTVSPPRPVAYFTAGRSTFLDGGIELYGLDPLSGDVFYHTRLSSPRPDPFEDVGMPGYMDGAKSDILVSDGSDLYLYQDRFRSDLTEVEAPLMNMEWARGGQRLYPADPQRGSRGKRLIATSGFLDDSFHEGTYWTYGERWPGWDRLMREVPSYGQLLVFDDRTVYGVHVFTDEIRVRRGFTPGQQGYRLFAREHAAEQDACRPFRPRKGTRSFPASSSRRVVWQPPVGWYPTESLSNGSGSAFMESQARGWPLRLLI